MTANENIVQAEVLLSQVDPDGLDDSSVILLALAYATIADVKLAMVRLS